MSGGQLKVYDAFLGVITNSPTYDWHLTNLRNYLHLSPDARQTMALGDLNLTPLGAGSGMLGLPGDYTPPSRFVRATALTASARPLKTSTDAVFEAFRILDNFNIPLGATVPRNALPQDITSATTTAAVELPTWDDSRVSDADETVVISHNWDELRRFMWDYVGIVRTNKRLERAAHRIAMLQDEIQEFYAHFQVTRDLLELRNLVQVADLIVMSALMRRESRGLHYSRDFPQTDDVGHATVLIPPPR